MTHDQIRTIAIRTVGFDVRTKEMGGGCHRVSTRRLDLPNKPTYACTLQPHLSAEQVDRKLKQLKHRSQIRKS